jgi:hypothetical protein
VSTLLHAIVNVFLHNLLNVLVQIENKMRLQENVYSPGSLIMGTVCSSEKSVSLL